MTTLSNIYSREKTLFYFTMWNDSDRKGYVEYLNYEIKNNLFIIKPAGQKGSVWYDMKELDVIEQKVQEKLHNDSTLVSRLQARLNTEWETLRPYLLKEKTIQSGDELEVYYTALVNWWSAMNTAFRVPDMEGVAPEVKKLFLDYRTESEKYTEQMNKTFVAFWDEQFPELADLLFFIAPHEAIACANGALSAEALQTISERKNGCILLNEILHPIAALEIKLTEQDLQLEKVEISENETIQGSVAYKVSELITGTVRIISGFKDMGDFQQGEILVTEMTNPDYVPIMKLAAAIVTDEGGITCHAAIASRELKVPCVIGTKVATKLLKNGDIIEVDASSGIIKIIG